MTTFLVLVIFGQAVLIITLIVQLAKRAEARELHDILAELQKLRETNATSAKTIQLLLMDAAEEQKPPPPAKKQPPKLANQEPPEYDVIRKGFASGAEFSRDDASQYILPDVHSAIQAIQRFGSIYMWVNDTRHEVKASFNPNETFFGEM